jgi:branched-chain amino acid transport system substrate-binding protein
MSAKDRMQHHDAWIDPETHHVEQTIYLAARNDKPVDPTDYFKILSWSEPSKVRDPESSKTCKLQSYESTPTYEN